MFDIGFQELVMIAVIALLVMGPERLPGAIRTTSLWIGKFRRGFQNIKQEIEQEIGADEIRRQLHNETIMNNLEKTQQHVKDKLKQSNQVLEESIFDVNGIIANTPSAAKPDETTSAQRPSQDHKPS